MEQRSLFTGLISVPPRAVVMASRTSTTPNIEKNWSDARHAGPASDVWRTQLEAALRNLLDEPVGHLQIVPVLHEHVGIALDANARQLNQPCFSASIIDGVHISRAEGEPGLPGTCGISDNVVAVHVQNRLHLLVAIELGLRERRAITAVALNVNHKAD